MSEPSKKPRKKRLPKNITELPDDQAILKLLPKKAVDEMNRLVDHEPTHRKPSK